MASDYAIIGGGIVGLSTAWGLLKRGLRVTVLDGDDDHSAQAAVISALSGCNPKA
jgi:glycine/D-amino acid oxidase-like deaminating enzyme